MKVAFVTHFCPHYRVKTFEKLAQVCNVEFFFYSPGNEWYGQGIHGVHGGRFRHAYLPGFQVTRHLRISPALLSRLWRKECDVIVKCINGRFALPLTYLIARVRGIRFVLWTGIWVTLQTRFHRLIFPITRWIYRHADAVVVYGDHVARYLVQQGVGTEKIFVAAHAVDNSFYSRRVSSEEKRRARAMLGSRGEKIVLYLGRLERTKGLEYLISAFAQSHVTDSLLVIAGSGSMSDELVALARAEHVEAKTRFIGYVAPSDALPFYALADVFVLPSITGPYGRELWGLVVNEAMNQGVPVIATDAVGAAAGGLVQSGVNGLVVPERNVPLLARAIEQILTDDRLRAKLGNNARQTIALWDNARMVRGFQQAIEYVVSNKKSWAGRTSLAQPH